MNLSSRSNIFNENSLLMQAYSQKKEVYSTEINNIYSIMQLPNFDELLAFRNSFEWEFKSNTDKRFLYKTFQALK